MEHRGRLPDDSARRRRPAHARLCEYPSSFLLLLALLWLSLGSRLDRLSNRSSCAPACLPLQGSTAPAHLASSPGDRARVFQGGYYLDLHKMLDISSGSEVGYS